MNNSPDSNWVFIGPITTTEIKKILSLKRSPSRIGRRASIGTDNPSRTIYADTPRSNFLMKSQLFPNTPELSKSFMLEYFAIENSLNNDSHYKSLDISDYTNKTSNNLYKSFKSASSHRYSRKSCIDPESSIAVSPVKSCNRKLLFDNEIENQLLQTPNKSITDIANECRETQFLDKQSASVLLYSPIIYESPLKVNEKVQQTIQEVESTLKNIKHEPMEDDSIVLISDDESTDSDVILLSGSDSSFQAADVHESSPKTDVNLLHISSSKDTESISGRNETVALELESGNSEDESITELNNTLDEMNMFLKYGPDYHINANTEIHSEPNDLVKSTQFLSPVLLPEENMSKEMTHQNQTTPNTSTKTPLREHDFNFKIPKRPLHLKQMNFKDVVSPVGLYIKSSTTPQIKHISAKSSPKMTLNKHVQSPNKKTDDRENVHSEIPRRRYEPAKHKIISDTKIKLPQSIEKHMSQIPVVIKHVTHISKKTELEDSMADLTNISMNASTASNEDISILTTKLAYMK